MEKLDFVIDVQGFHDKNGDFIPKEIAVIGVDCNFISHWLIKPPYNYSEMSKGIIATNSYLTCYHHGIEWFDGESNLEDVYNRLKEVARGALRIYARGIQKVELLEKIVSRQIINLEDYQCPSYKNLPRINDHYCFYHGNRKEHFACALTFAYKLKYWLMKTLYTKSELSYDEVDLKKQKKIAEGSGEANNKGHESSVNQTQTSVEPVSVSSTVSPSSTDITAVTDTPTTATTTTITATIHKPRRRSPVARTNRYSRYEQDIYEKAEGNEHLSDKACTHTRASADSRSFSGRQDTLCVGETVCGCS